MGRQGGVRGCRENGVRVDLGVQSGFFTSVSRVFVMPLTIRRRNSQCRKIAAAIFAPAKAFQESSFFFFCGVSCHSSFSIGSILFIGASVVAFRNTPSVAGLS